MRVVGAFGSGEDALTQPRADGEIVFYDLGTMIEALRGQHAGTKVLVFDVTDNDQAIIECVRAGASGCILREASAEDMLAAIRSLTLGTPPASPELHDPVQRPFGPPETESAYPPGADPLVAVGQAVGSVSSLHLQVLRY